MILFEHILNCGALGRVSATVSGVAYKDLDGRVHSAVKRVNLDYPCPNGVDVTRLILKDERAHLEELIRERFIAAKDRNELTPEDWHREEPA